MTVSIVTYLPLTGNVEDEATRTNFEFIESNAVFMQSPMPTITGSRSGATAAVLAQVLAALSACGLVFDATTP